MNQIATLINMDFMQAVKEKVDEKYGEINPSFEDSQLSRLLFREQLDPKNIELTHAHIQVIHKQLNRLYSDEFLKVEAIFLEFSKSITLFDSITRILEIDGGVCGDNFIASQNFYLDAISSCKVSA